MCNYFFVYICVLLFFFRYIDSINRQNLSYKLKVNHMADLSQAERKMMRGYQTSSDSPLGELYLSKTNVADVPESFNWRLRGMIETPNWNYA